jgi:small ligand-binding sensory domain FIST
LPDLRSLRLPRKEPCTVATGFASGERATADLAARAVEQALQRAHQPLAGSVLLFLTSHFGRNTQLAVSAASRTAHCLQVAGCTAAGVFTESDWSLDAPAAAALVLAGDNGLVTPAGDCTVLTLTTAATQRLPMDGARERFGICCADGDGDLPARVWQHGRLADNDRCELAFANARTATRVSRGLRLLSPILEVTGTDGYDLFAVNGRPALATLLDCLPPSSQPEARPPFSHLFAALTDASGDAADALRNDRCRLVPILGASPDEQSLTLAMPLAPGDRLFWVLRQPAAAEQDSMAAVAELAESIAEPDFAVVFSCIGRGPYFFGTADRDLDCLLERFPALPVIGAYGAGEIGPVAGHSALLSYSAVLTVVDCVHP